MQNNRKIGTPVIIATLFIAAIATFTHFNYITREVFFYYLSLNIITFLFYVYDKVAAQKGRWRIQENTLHLLALFGGWAGALVAQDVFRHKTKKTAFRTAFFITAFVNFLGLIYMHNL